MMLVYYHIDELSRDAVVASCLKKKMRELGIKLVYGNRLTSRLLHRYNCFDAIILPSLPLYQTYFSNPLDLPTNIYILPTEAVGRATGNPRRINAKYFGNDEVFSIPWHSSIKGFFLWGYQHSQDFNKQYSKYLENVHVVGHPRLDRCCLPNKENLKINDKTKVGLITRFSLLNTYHYESMIDNIYNGIKLMDIFIPTYENSPDKDIEDLIYTEAVDIRLFILIIKALSNRNKYDLHLRIHPKENRISWKKIIKKHGLNINISKWDAPFSHWMHSMDVLVSPPSTSFYEIFLSGRVPICTMDMSNHRQSHTLTESDNNNQILEYVKRPKEIDELILNIDNYQESVIHPDVQKILMGQVASDITGESISSISKIIMKDLSNIKNRTKLTNKYLFVILSTCVSYLELIKNSLLLRKEQSSIFYLTIRRIIEINKLYIQDGYDNKG